MQYVLNQSRLRLPKEGGRRCGVPLLQGAGDLRGHPRVLGTEGAAGCGLNNNILFVLLYYLPDMVRQTLCWGLRYKYLEGGDFMIFW